VSLCGGCIQVSQEWIPKTWSADDLINRAEIIQGLRFARLTDVLAYKQMLMRPKDIADIQALSQILVLAAIDLLRIAARVSGLPSGLALAVRPAGLGEVSRVKGGS
jgi:hypothetical protein